LEMAKFNFIPYCFATEGQPRNRKRVSSMQHRALFQHEIKFIRNSMEVLCQHEGFSRFLHIAYI